jgi:HK97 gp10 family phage protein
MASTFTLTWHGPQVTERLRQAADRGVLRAANLFRNEYVRLILDTGKSGHTYTRRGIQHTASAPGEPPASDTGRLIQSVRVDHQPNSLVAVIGVGTKYAAMLEFGTQTMKPRPAFMPAYQTKKAEMQAVIASEISKEMQRG